MAIKRIQLQQEVERLKIYSEKKREYEKNFRFSQTKAMKEFEMTPVALRAKKEGWWEDFNSYKGLKSIIAEFIKISAFHILNSHYKIDVGGIGIENLGFYKFNKKLLNEHLKGYTEFGKNFIKKSIEESKVINSLPIEIYKEIRNTFYKNLNQNKNYKTR